MPPLRRSWLGRTTGALAAGTLLVVTPVSSRAQADLPSELTTVSQVRFEGRRQVKAKELSAALKTRTSSRFLFRDRPLLRLDFLRADTAAIENIYHQHGYLDAGATYRLTPSAEPGAVIVTFVIREGPRTRISRVELAGVTVVPQDPLRRTLFARKGKPFNPYFLSADTMKIAEIYKDRGYFPAVRSATRREGAGIVVRYDVTEGPRYRIGDVRLANLGQLTVSERFVRRELLLKPGSFYRSTRVQQSIERLYETGVFSQVQMAEAVDSAANRVEFDLALSERKPRWVDAGIGSGTTERLLATGQWGHRNLWTRGMQGVVSGRLALDGQARFLLSRIETSLLEPWLFATRTRGLATLYFENRQDRTDSRKLVETRVEGVSFQLQRQLGRYARLSLTEDNTFVRQDATFRAPYSDSLRAVLSQDVTPSYTTHRLQLGAQRDTRDFPILMTRGSFQTASAEVAGGPLRGTSSFTKQQFASSWYTPIKPGWVFATHARGGLIRPYGRVVKFSSEPDIDPEVARVPDLDRFKIGGVNSLRGYDENELPANGGLVVLQANAELRVDILGPFGVETYVEAGNVWTRPSDVRRGSFSPRLGTERMSADDVRWVFGLGPRLQLPFGPLRLDVSWWARPDATGKRQRAKVQFAIGPAF